MGVHKYLDASTRYVTENDRETLSDWTGASGRASANPLIIIDTEYGWWIHECRPDPADSPEYHKEWDEDRRAIGLSDAFWALMDKAAEMGCAWVNLDSDGDTDLDLPFADEPAEATP